MSLKQMLEEELAEMDGSYGACGIVDKAGTVYPLGTDTKVLSTIFELISRPAIYKVAKQLGLQVREPSVQNHYPDFTLMTSEDDQNKIAIDVKTTYRRDNGTFGFTLGSYTSFIREGNERKNIVYPFNEYAEHWVLGFVYDRLATKKAAAEHSFRVDQIKDIPLPFENVDVFVQEKWRISSDRAGSGNTTNIGSITGTIEDFREGRGVFHSEEEFLQYWRGYGRTKQDRDGNYSRISEYRETYR